MIVRIEKEKTREIYNRHPDLVIFTRDPVSDRIARSLFPNLKIFCMPDFVLSLNTPVNENSICERNKKREVNVMICFRGDTQSAIPLEAKNRLLSLLKMNDYKYFHYETLLDHPIRISQQAKTVDQVLNKFIDSDAVITDRLHGLIFAIQMKLGKI